MKDNAVGPAGLFDIRRGHRLLASLESRSRWWANHVIELEKKHELEREVEHSQLESKRTETAIRCRDSRRVMLDKWDQSEEKTMQQYEVASIKMRQELNRLGVLYRRKIADERQTIERKVEARRQAVLHQYDNRKNQPGQQKRKEIKSIDESLTAIGEELEWARALTIRRLDRLPEVPSDFVDPSVPVPDVESVTQTLDAVHNLTRSCHNVVVQMQTGAASKIVDSFYLPAGVAVFIVVWAVTAFFIGPQPPWLAMAAGVPVAGVIGFTIYLILLLPLKKMTRQLYPKVEYIGRLTESTAEKGRRISTRIANETSAELVQRRDAHLDAAQRWRVEHLAESETRLANEESEARRKLEAQLQAIDQRFATDFGNVHDEMHTRAEKLAQTITQDLADTDALLQQERDAGAARRLNELHQARQRLRQGLRRGFNRILTTGEHVEWRFPDWPTVLKGEQPVSPHVDFLPVGQLCIASHVDALVEMRFAQAELHKEANSTHAAANVLSNEADLAIRNGSDGGSPSGALTGSLPPDSLPATMPVVLHRRLHSGLLITAPASHLPQAIELVHQILWRLLSGAKPGRAKLTLIDPIGRGQHFTSFMALADHDPSIVSHRVWAAENKIESRLAELSHHVEDILQTCLRDRFERIEDYNEVAGSMAEPYRGIAAIGFPEALSREAYKHLRALLESGGRCGITTLLVCDEAKPWPSDMPLPAIERWLKLRIDAAGRWSVDHPGVDHFELTPYAAPPAALRAELTDSIGKAACAAARVEIPLESILSAQSEATGRTDEGIRIPIGSQGANRILSLELGEGVCQHTLIAGKTGSGKSTLLHAIITAGLFQYQPSELQFYLLDFKKGVEFKPYADCRLPHVRVIGIESEREFGRSVLQRLDLELQRRGELFRAAAVQEVASYREATHQEMPRLMLVIDEFQELFVRDDRLASDCALLLDRLVRQGRSFGIHVVLSSQSLAGAYSLPRATLGQMAVRIAMQCSEADAAMILADDNTAARLLARPGEAIYNDASGLVEGNQPFQVAWLTSERQREMLKAISARDSQCFAHYPPPVIFEGNRPAKWSPELVNQLFSSQTNESGASGSLRGLLGEAVEIGPPVSIELQRNAGRNVLLVSAGEHKSAVLASLVSSMGKGSNDFKVVYFDGSRADDGPSAAAWLESTGLSIDIVKPRDCDQRLKTLTADLVARGDMTEGTPPIVVVIDPLDRFRDLRQDESFSFSLDSAGMVSAASQLQTLLREGPAARVFTIVVCNNTETFSRWLPRASQHDLELRVMGVLNASDSSMLIDSPAAADLSAATMLVYDDADGRITKFRFVDQPDPECVKQWLHQDASHQAPAN